MLKFNSNFSSKFIYEFFFSYPAPSNLTKLWRVGVYFEINNRYFSDLAKEESKNSSDPMVVFAEKIVEYESKGYFPFEVRFYIELDDVDIQLLGKNYLKESIQNNLDLYIRGLRYVFERSRKYFEDSNSFIFEDKEYKVSDLIELMSVNIFWDEEIIEIKDALEYNLKSYDNIIDLKVKYFFDYLSIESKNLYNKNKSKMLVNMTYFFKGDLGIDLSNLEKNSSESSLYLKRLESFFYTFVNAKIHFRYLPCIISLIYIFTIYGRHYNYDPLEVFSTKSYENEKIVKSTRDYENLKIAKGEEYKITIRQPSNLETYLNIWAAGTSVSYPGLYWKNVSTIEFYGTEEEQRIKREAWIKLFKEYEKYVNDDYPNFSQDYNNMYVVNTCVRHLDQLTNKDERDWRALWTSYIIDDYILPSRFEGGGENKVMMQISLETVSYFDLCLSNYKNKNT
jgi:hypothetical protein